MMPDDEGYALGSYGLPSIVYARFLEARWLELVGLSEGSQEDS